MENLRSRPYAWMPLSSRINVFILQIWPKKHLKKSPRKHLQENPHGLLLIPSKSWSCSCDDDGLKTRVIWWVFIPRNWSFHTPDSWKKSAFPIFCAGFWCFGGLVCLRKTHRVWTCREHISGGSSTYILLHCLLHTVYFQMKLGCGFKHCLFSPILLGPRGNDPIWLAHIFQIGWNHKLGNTSPTLAFTIFSPIPCMNSSCRASGSIQGICGRTVPSPPLEARGLGNLRINEGLNNLEHVQEKEDYLQNIISGISYQI